jgi:hypothetical protein
MLNRYTINMSEVPQNKLEDVVKRNRERHHKADHYTAGKSTAAKIKAKTATNTANAVNTGMTLTRSKTLGALSEGGRGMLKGMLIGVIAGPILGAVLPFSFMAPGLFYFTAITLYHTIKGGNDGYYKAEMSSAGRKAERKADRIAAAGGAQPSQAKDENIKKAFEEARGELPEMRPEDFQDVDEIGASRSGDAPTEFQDRINAERQEAAQSNDEIKM